MRGPTNAWAEGTDNVQEDASTIDGSAIILETCSKYWSECAAQQISRPAAYGVLVSLSLSPGGHRLGHGEDSGES